MKILLFYSSLLFCCMSLASIRREDLRDNDGNPIKPHAIYLVSIIDKDRAGHSGFDCEGVMIAGELQNHLDDDLFTIQKISLLSRLNCLSRNSVQYQQIKNIRRNNPQSIQIKLTIDTTNL